MTQADVARVLEIEHGLKLHPTAIAKMEQRDVDKPRAIRLFEARAIADVFGLTVDEMMATGNAEVEALSREFTQLEREAEALRARTDDLFRRLRPLTSVMVVPADQVTPELQEYRNRIIRSLATMHEVDEARRLKAEALLDEAVASGKKFTDDDRENLNAAASVAAATERTATRPVENESD